MAAKKFTRPGGVSPLSSPARPKRGLRRVKELWTGLGLVPPAEASDHSRPESPGAGKDGEVGNGD